MQNIDNSARAEEGLSGGLDAGLPAAPAGGFPAPGGFGYSVDFSDPKQAAKLSPEVRKLAQDIGATRATATSSGRIEQVAITLVKPHTLLVSDPDIRRIFLDRDIKFTAERHANGALHFRDISGIELDVGRFMPRVQPREISIQPDGTFVAKASAMGMVGTRGGSLPAAAHDLLKKALDDLNRIQTGP